MEIQREKKRILLFVYVFFFAFRRISGRNEAFHVPFYGGQRALCRNANGPHCEGAATAPKSTGHFGSRSRRLDDVPDADVPIP